MELKADYGTHLREQDIGRHVRHVFHSVWVDHFTLLGPRAGFTTFVILVHEGREYGASFDMPDELWEALLAALPEDVADAMVAELQHARSVPYTVELTRAVRVQVVARPGKPQRGAHDTFVPLVVERIENTEAADTASPLPFDPELMTAVFGIGVFHFEAGTRQFQPWSVRIIEEVGEGVRPYLHWAYEALRHWPGLNTEGMDDEAVVDAS